MPKTISKGYALENGRLHEVNPSYGASGHLWLGHIVEIARLSGAKTLLDYGCGKATLRDYVEPHGLSYTGYDPATYPERPRKEFDLVVALDVLEHIEPEHLDAVVLDLMRYCKLLMFAVVSTRPSGKSLSDGRNAHLIQKDWGWWKMKLIRSNAFRSVWVRQTEDHFTLLAYPTTHPLSRESIMKLRGQG